MRKFIILTVAGLLLLAGCADPVEFATDSVDTSDAAPAYVDAEREAFLALAREAFPGASDEDLLDTAETTCDAIESYDGDVEALVWDLAFSDFGSTGTSQDMEDAGYFIGISIGYACPEYGIE